ncbi:uncharacterized protein ABDE67_000117 [Symphorus nematophorus]
MAPTEVDVEWQTNAIIRCLFEDDTECGYRTLDASLECDGPEGSNDDNFDPVLIADRLRQVADGLNDSVKFQAALSDLKKAVAQEAAETAFSNSVEALCKTQSAEVVSEVQLIKASVAFGLYVMKSCPEMKRTVQGAMSSFLNRRVRTWVTQQGGWEKVDIQD